MGSFEKYECDGQMNLFDYITSEQHQTVFCWDNDINEIVQAIENLAATYKLEIGKIEFKVWDHVPNLGYRLWLEIKVTREELSREDFRADIIKLVAKAKERNIELTPMWGACMFFGREENEKGRLAFATMFIDKARQRRKKP